VFFAFIALLAFIALKRKKTARFHREKRDERK